MTLDFLPPQAYTKETLLKAYNWLQHQSEQVKELATTPDHLVSLYLKSSRSGTDSIQRYTPPTSQSTTTQTTAPVADRPSVQSFKSELKNLAGMMGDLEKPQAPQQSTQQAYVPPPQQAAPMTTPTNAYVSQNVSSQPMVQNTFSYDEMTQNLIREVKNELNLSTDSEALRMLVKIGYQKVKSLYK